LGPYYTKVFHVTAVQLGKNAIENVAKQMAAQSYHDTLTTSIAKTKVRMHIPQQQLRADATY
jgi:hypothetical protein